MTGKGRPPRTDDAPPPKPEAAPPAEVQADAARRHARPTPRGTPRERAETDPARQSLPAPDRTPLVVSGPQAGQKLMQYLGRVLDGDLPGSVLMRWIRTGQVRVDGRRAKPFDRLEEGQVVRLPPFASPKAGPVAGQTKARDVFPDAQDKDQPAPGRDGGNPDQRPRPEADDTARTRAMLAAHGLTLLAATGRWLALSKQAGLPVHPGSGWTDSVQTRLERAFAGQGFVPALCHRLDRDTTGILLAARTHAALRQAHDLFRQGLAVKEYLCWVHGRWRLSPLGRAAILEDRIEKTGAPGRQRMSPSPSVGSAALGAGAASLRPGRVASDESSPRSSAASGKLARLSASPLAVEGDRTLLAVRLFTGRTHQIRAQFASRGHPLCGDAKYGGGPGPLMLHAWRLTLADEAFVCPPLWSDRWRATELAERARPLVRPDP